MTHSISVLLVVILLCKQRSKGDIKEVEYKAYMGKYLSISAKIERQVLTFCQMTTHHHVSSELQAAILMTQEKRANASLILF